MNPTALLAAGQLAAVLTGEAAAHLRADGTLQVAGVMALGVPQIDSSEAGKLAQVWAFSSASMVLRELEKQHGGKIDIPSLHPCGRVMYARSAQLTHRKIAAVPELVVTGIDFPNLARWHLTLDTGTVLSAGSTHSLRSVQHLYLGLNFATGTPLSTTPSVVQPDSVKILIVSTHARIGAPYAGKPQFRPFYLHRAPGYPVSLDTVSAPSGRESHAN